MQDSLVFFSAKCRNSRTENLGASAFNIPCIRPLLWKSRQLALDVNYNTYSSQERHHLLGLMSLVCCVKANWLVLNTQRLYDNFLQSMHMDVLERGSPASERRYMHCFMAGRFRDTIPARSECCVAGNSVRGDRRCFHWPEVSFTKKIIAGGDYFLHNWWMRYSRTREK